MKSHNLVQHLLIAYLLFAATALSAQTLVTSWEAEDYILNGFAGGTGGSEPAIATHVNFSEGKAVRSISQSNLILQNFYVPAEGTYELKIDYSYTGDIAAASGGYITTRLNSQTKTLSALLPTAGATPGAVIQTYSILIYCEAGWNTIKIGQNNPGIAKYCPYIDKCEVWSTASTISKPADDAAALLATLYPVSFTTKNMMYDWDLTNLPCSINIIDGSSSNLSNLLDNNLATTFTSSSDSIKILFDFNDSIVVKHIVMNNLLKLGKFKLEVLDGAIWKVFGMKPGYHLFADGALWIDTQVAADTENYKNYKLTLYKAPGAPQIEVDDVLFIGYYYTKTIVNGGTSYPYMVDDLTSPANGTFIDASHVASTYNTLTGFQTLDNARGSKYPITAKTFKFSYHFNTPTCVKSFLLSNSTTAARDAKAFEIQGSNDNLSWTSLYSITNLYWKGRNYMHGGSINNSTAYTYYRFDYQSNNGDGTYSEISDLLLFSTVNPTISFATPITVNKNFGDAAFTNTLTTNSNGTITYSSNNTSVATVNEMTGEVTIVSPGWAVITATVAANTDYNAVSAMYTLKVSAYFSTKTSGNWNAAETWSCSGDNATWVDATVSPSATNALSVNIQNGHSVTITDNATSSALVINPTAKLTLNSGYTLAITGNLNISSNATSTGTFVDANTANGLSVSGTTTVQQYLAGAVAVTAPSGRFWYISSPVIGATSTVFNALGRNKVWNYTESAHGYTEIVDNGTLLTTGTGYVVRLGADTTVTFTGALYSGDKTISLTRNDGNEKSGYNLVGNPYASFIDYHAATLPGTVMPSIWTRSCTEGGLMKFDTYNSFLNTGTSGSGKTVTQYIAPMQAFWVKVASGNTEGSITLTNAMRSVSDQTESTNKLKAPAVSTQQVLRLQVSNDTNSDEAVIAFNADASDGFDNYDSPKMPNENAAIPEIYTLAETEKVAINGMKNIATIPVGFTTGETNTFRIKATEIENFDADIRIILKDNLLKIEKELTDGAPYTFTSDATTTDSRFSIVFKSASLTTGIESVNCSVNIYKNSNGLITIHSDGAKGTITVCNSLGQKLANASIAGTSTVINNSFTSGVYFVTVTVSGSMITKKVIIN